MPFHKSIGSVNRLLESVTDVVWKRTETFRFIEFSYFGQRYRLCSTGDLYKLSISSQASPVAKVLEKSKKMPYITVYFSDNSGYYPKYRTKVPLKGLIWSVFGTGDVPKSHHIRHKNDNPMNCNINNLEVVPNGVSQKGS